MNKQIAVALSAAVVAVGCATGPNIQTVGRGTYMVTETGPATSAGYGGLTKTADSEAEQYCAGRHATMKVLATNGTAQIQDPQGGLFAGGVSGDLEVQVTFQCPPATDAP